VALRTRGRALARALLPRGVHVAGAGRRHRLPEQGRDLRARLVGALLMGRRILIGENLFGFQVGKFLVTVIAQEQRLASVADENHGVVGDCELSPCNWQQT
jgi:hypothetical protein